MNREFFQTESQEPFRDKIITFDGNDKILHDHLLHLFSENLPPSGLQVKDVFEDDTLLENAVFTDCIQSLLEDGKVKWDETFSGMAAAGVQMGRSVADVNTISQRAWRRLEEAIDEVVRK